MALTSKQAGRLLAMILISERGQMRELDTHAQAGIQPRSNLHIPEMPPAGARLQH